MTQNDVVLLLITLVPIVPAYLLFKLLPAKAVVTGPFKGLRIDLSGAFGGYFLVFLVLIAIRGSVLVPQYSEWVVSGQIVRPDAESSEIYIDPRYVTLSVPSLRSDADGNFTMDFVTTSDGQLDYPHMYINYPGYKSVAYWLGPKDKNLRKELLPVTFDPQHRRIDLGVVRLVKLPPQSAGAGPNVAPANPYGG